MFYFNPSVVVLNHADKLETEHLSVDSKVVIGYNPFLSQIRFAVNGSTHSMVRAFAFEQAVRL
jgi:hypothetical protein